MLNPLAAPGGSLEGIGEVLCLVHDLAVVELHHAHRIHWFALVSDGVFGDPKIAISEDSPDVEAGRLAGMMAPQGLQVAPAEDSLAGLGIIAYRIVVVDFVLRIEISACGCVPMCIEGLPDLFVLHGLLLAEISASIILHLLTWQGFLFCAQSQRSRSLCAPAPYVAQDSVDHDLKPKDAHGGDDGFREEDCERVEVDSASHAGPSANGPCNDCDCGCNQKACSFAVSVAWIVLPRDGSGGARPKHKPQEKHECAEEGAGDLEELEVQRGTEERQLNRVAEKRPVIVRPIVG